MVLHANGGICVFVIGELLKDINRWPVVKHNVSG